MPTILALSGSLRADSSNQTLLRVLAEVAPSHVRVQVYEGLAHLPPFSPGPDDEPPATVSDLRRQLADADGVLICTPEYAFGIPGALKNALDWTVGSGEFYGKPVALITASSLGEKAHQALQWVFEALGANVVVTLLVANVRTKVNAEGITDLATRAAVEGAMRELIIAVEN